MPHNLCVDAGLWVGMQEGRAGGEGVRVSAWGLRRPSGCDSVSEEVWAANNMGFLLSGSSDQLNS